MSYINNKIVKYQHRKPINDTELGYYLAGLIEGDGYSGDRRLEIIFHEMDAPLADYLQQRIGYGSVSKIKGKKAVKYVCRHSEGLYYVCSITNNKYRTQHKLNQLISHNYPKYFGIRFEKNTNACITQDHWLAGFTDADGCFHISIIKSPTHSIGYSVRLEYKITQKDNTTLKLIQQNFGGCVSFTHRDQLSRYNSTNFKVARRVVDYFDNFHLNSVRQYGNYVKWRQIYLMTLRKEHLTKEGLSTIRYIRQISSDTFNVYDIQV